MSDDKTYGSVDELIDGVREFVKSPTHTPGSFVGFKIHVFLGRGVHKFELDDKESEVVRDIASLKKMLEEAEKKLQTVRDNRGKKRARTSSSARSYDTGWPSVDFVEETFNQELKPNKK